MQTPTKFAHSEMPEFRKIKSLPIVRQWNGNFVSFQENYEWNVTNVPIKSNSHFYGKWEFETV